MNWHHVLKLISVDIKSGRLIRGQRLRRYRESRVLQYVMYGGSCLLGIAVGLLVRTVYSGVTDPEMKTGLLLNVKVLFIAAPTLVLTYSLVFTMMRQIQRAGITASIQPPYWLPITWGEHTLAAIVANLIGVQLAALLAIVSTIGTVSIFLGETPLAALTIFALLAVALLASATTEIFRILQVRLTGAVYKTSGKAAIWVRFFGSLLLFIAFYAVYFFFTSGANFVAIIDVFASGQTTVWFIPYLWLGMALFSFMNSRIVDTALFSLGALAFLGALFTVAVKLNSRFGLYEPPAIRISREAYAPRPSIWSRLGFSLPEAAIMRKDFRAFTRRRELMYFFVLPILITMIFVMSLTRTPYFEASSVFSALILLVPGASMALMLGSVIIGQEGAPVWHLSSSPVAAESLVKCKFAFIVIFSCAVTLACSIVGIVIVRPSPTLMLVALIESIFLIISLSAVSLRAGIKGASFVEVPRPRMISPRAGLINTITCALLAGVILAPLIPYASAMLGLLDPPSQSYTSLALAASGAIAAIVTYGFYRIAVKNAEDLFAEVDT